MVVYVATPLYDAVFKYLMEDDRIAKTILSELLEKDGQLKEKDEMLRKMIKRLGREMITIVVHFQFFDGSFSCGA